ncbi:MAG: hypothetical protein H8E44_07270 [Planctomycetes bacterium]|nr:hypothetical protein [Planctomycetota bacterium]
MPSPRTTLNGYRPDLGMMLQFDDAMNRNGFVANQVAPVIEVPEQKGTIGVIELKQLLKEPETGRNSRGDYNRTSYQFVDETYETFENGLEMPIDDRRSKIYRNWFDFEVMSARIVLDQVLRAYEKRVADLLYNATTFASYTTAVTNEWNDWTNATPLTDVIKGKRSMWAAVGLYPNALIINKRQFDSLRMNAQVIDKLESGGAGQTVVPGEISKAQLTACFDLDQIIVSDSARDSANEGASVSIAPMWSDEYAMLARIARTNNPEEPSLCRTVHWGEDGSSIGGTLETYYSDPTRGDVIRVRHETEERLFYTALGYLFSNVIDAAGGDDVP